jgi:hypothetical protein
MVAGLLSGLMVPSCGGKDGAAVKPTPSCLRPSDCDNPLLCVQGYCVAACLESRDCPAGQRCVKTDDGVACQPPEQKTCRYTSECAQPLVCAGDQQCRNQCQTDIDCPRGARCTAESRLCADPKIDTHYDPVKNEFTFPPSDASPPPDARPDGGPPPDAAQADAPAGTDSAPGPDAAPMPDAAQDMAPAGAGDPCVAAAMGFAPEVTPNEDRDHATPLALGATYPGCLQVVSDIDYYQFTVPAGSAQGGWVVVRVGNVTARGMVLTTVFAAADNGRIVEMGSRTEGADTVAHFSARAGTVFRVMVTNRFQDPARNGAYSITVTFQEATEVGEPNNLRPQATPVQLGTPAQGRYFAGMEQSTAPAVADWFDWFRVSLPAAPVTVLVSNGPLDIPVTVVLYDGLGAEIKRANSFTAGADVQLTHTIPTAGDYHVVVVPTNCCALPAGEGATLPAYASQPYTLTVTSP